MSVYPLASSDQEHKALRVDRYVHKAIPRLAERQLVNSEMY
jgi:hypothetical protein